jgi:hypothetical protein
MMCKDVCTKKPSTIDLSDKETRTDFPIDLILKEADQFGH